MTVPQQDPYETEPAPPSPAPPPGPTPPVGAAPRTPAREFTEPLRELVVWTLLAGNAVFLLMGLSELFLVIGGWASNFGLRSASVFPTFAGPTAIGLPMLAMLLATHVAPQLRRARSVLATVQVELAVSAVLGVVTFLGAFAHDVVSARSLMSGLAVRSVWLALLALACVLSVRVWLGTSARPAPAPMAYRTYPQPTYGRPYPGQPMLPQPTYKPGTAKAAPSAVVTAETTETTVLPEADTTVLPAGGGISGTALPDTQELPVEATEVVPGQRPQPTG